MKNRYTLQSFCRSLMVGLLLVTPIGMWAQEVPHYEIAGAYSYVRASSGNGGESFNVHGASFSGAYNLNRLVALTADFGGYKFTGMPPGINADLYTFLVGPRFSYRRYERLTPFAQILAGAARHTASTANDKAGENSFAMTLGGGLDVSLNQRLALRPMQVDYLITRFANATGQSSVQNNLRVCAGIVFRFGRL